MHKKAFTLIELLITLIVTTIIIAALTPTITKRINKKNYIVKSTSQTIDTHGSLFLPFDGSAKKSGKNFECEDIDPNTNTITCEIKNITTPYVNAVIVGGGGGGASAVLGYKTSNKNKNFSNGGTYKIPVFNMQNVKITLVGGGASGGGGIQKEEYIKTKSYIDTCPDKTERVKVGTGIEYCVTKYNLRPENYSEYRTNNTIVEESFSKEIPVSIAPYEFIPYGSTENIASKQLPACYSGVTNFFSDTGDYSSKGRTICNYWAAEKMCQNLNLGINCKDNFGNIVSCKGKWRLPSRDEVQSSTNISDITSTGYLYGIFFNNYNGLNDNIKNSLQLCGSGSTANPRCYSTLSCDNTSVCYPHILWSEFDTYSSYGASVYNTYNSTSIYSTHKRGGYSVRCVLETGEYEKIYTIHSGGGGSGGTAVKNINVPQEIIDDCFANNKNCYFELKIGAAQNKVGKGLKAKAINSPDKAEDGLDGNPTSVEIKTGDTILWGYKVEGGKAGKGASIDGPGLESDNANLCYENKGSGYSTGFSCNEEYNNNSGLPGNSSENNGTTNFGATTGGIGGKNSFNSYGKGGNGGGFKTNSASEYGNGTQGSNGYATISYGGYYRGASGGGGGGGSLARIEKIYITENETLQIQIGSGGSMGKNSTKGTKGTETTITLKNKIYYSAPGGEGGEIGTRDTDNKIREAGKGGAGGKITGKIYHQGEDIILSDGENGENGFFLENKESKEDAIKNNYTAIGGSGGKSGTSLTMNILMYTSACGGLYVNQKIGCDNLNNVNGLGADFIKANSNLGNVNHIGNYGIYGTGGGGGGWKYDETTGKETAGNGGSGQGGYVYLWW